MPANKFALVSLRQLAEMDERIARDLGFAAECRALTSTDDAEAKAALATQAATDAGIGLMHEAIDADDATLFTCPWFAWSNTKFAGLLLRITSD